jgi:hypothetical protein
MRTPWHRRLNWRYAVIWAQTLALSAVSFSCNREDDTDFGDAFGALGDAFSNAWDGLGDWWDHIW